MYKQVTDQIKEAIVSGALASGTRLASIRELSRELELSPITIRRAYHDLEREGCIITRAGLGSYVAAISRDRFREEKIKEMRNELARIVAAAEKLGVSSEDIEKIMNEMRA